MRIISEIIDEMTKNRRKEILSKYLQQLVEKWNSSTVSNTMIHSK